jgi:hypothetical protein
MGAILLSTQVMAQDKTGKSKAKPDVRVKVQKEYDDQGNITRYDSTYSYSWSGDGDTPCDIDSLFKGFNRGFGFSPGWEKSILERFGFRWWNEGDSLPDNPFRFNYPFDDFWGNQPWPNDSLMFDEGFDILGQGYQQMLKRHREMMDRMFEEFYRGIPESHDNNQNLKPSKPKDQVIPRVQKQGYNRDSFTDRTVTM